MLVELEQPRAKLKALRVRIDEVGEALGLESLREEAAELQETMAEPDFWNDLARSTRINQRFKHVSGRLEHHKSLCDRADDIEAMMDLVDEEGDPSMVAEVVEDLGKLEADIEALSLETLLRGDYDANNAILSLHAGAGGTEAQDWTQMLYRMYMHYCEHHGFTVKQIDLLLGDEAGIKSVTWEVDGDNAYGFLRSEKGVHRLVRISPFDANARRHTSFTSLDVSPIIEDDEFTINWDDVRIDTYRATGAGGQHINRTDSAVRMTHIPTGIVVQCQNERSQIQNREVCVRMLKSKLLELREREKEEKMAEIKGEMKKIEWGSQIRSYVFQPYTLVKDHRTGHEEGNISEVMDGKLEGFVIDYLQKL